MRLALDLARRAQGQTAPNPAVGSVVVKRGCVVGQGFHRRAGGPHAEAIALRAAGRRARGATLYVTLEPCNHYGRTPPCCDAILNAGIAHVVVASQDPNPITNGRGIRRLQHAGVRLTVGVLAEQAHQLNQPFFKAMHEGLPFVIAKIGQSLDGKIATARGESQWITSTAARRIGHTYRRDVDAILVGMNTILRDDPLLTARGVTGRVDRPVKVIVDTHLRTPARARCLSRRSPAPTLIATTATDAHKREQLAQRGAEVVCLSPKQGRVPLKVLCRRLVQRGIHSVLIEGGGEVMASAFAERLVDRLVWFIAPILIGGRDAPTSFGGAGIRRLAQAVTLADVHVSRVGTDLCVEARVVYPKGAGGRRRAARESHPPLAPRPAPRASHVLA